MKYVLLIVSCLLCCIACVDDSPQLRSNYPVQGIDVSHYQSQIDWDEVAKNKLYYAYVKSTEGKDYIDSMFTYNWLNSRRVGLKRGAYHFYRPRSSALAQANHFIQQVELLPGDLPPVVDVEVLDGVDAAELIVGLRMYLKHIELHYSVKPVIYTYQKFYNRYLAGQFSEYPIWIARYHSRQPKLANKDKWVFWQYAQRGIMPGIEGAVDLNVFHGSHTELEQWCVPAAATAQQLATQ
ncbi:MAG: GH25 family lysozyme [Bacteroidota bacterium]